MTSQRQAPDFALRRVLDKDLPDAAWWPRSRSLGDQLQYLFERWPDDAGRIVRVLYSPPDWDDRPRAVDMPGQRVKTGAFPRDDTHQLVLSMLDGHRRSVTVIPPDTNPQAARTILESFADPSTPGLADEQPDWDNEGGTP